MRIHPKTSTEMRKLAEKVAGASISICEGFPWLMTRLC